MRLALLLLFASRAWATTAEDPTLSIRLGTVNAQNYVSEPRAFRSIWDARYHGPFDLRGRVASVKGRGQADGWGSDPNFVGGDDQSVEALVELGAPIAPFTDDAPSFRPKAQVRRNLLSGEIPGGHRGYQDYDVSFEGTAIGKFLPWLSVELGPKLYFTNGAGIGGFGRLVWDTQVTTVFPQEGCRFEAGVDSYQKRGFPDYSVDHFFRVSGNCYTTIAEHHVLGARAQRIPRVDTSFHAVEEPLYGVSYGYHFSEHPEALVRRGAIEIEGGLYAPRTLEQAGGVRLRGHVETILGITELFFLFTAEPIR